MRPLTYLPFLVASSVYCLLFLLVCLVLFSLYLVIAYLIHNLFVSLSLLVCRALLVLLRWRSSIHAPHEDLGEVTSLTRVNGTRTRVYIFQETE